MEPSLGWIVLLITVVGAIVLAGALWYGTRHDRGGSRWRAPTDPTYAGSKPESAETAHFPHQVDPDREPEIDKAEEADRARRF